MSKASERRMNDKIVHMMDSKRNAESVWEAYEAEKQSVLLQMVKEDLDTFTAESEDSTYKVTRVQGEKVEVIEEEAKKLPKEQLRKVLDRHVEFDEAAFKIFAKNHPELKDEIRQFAKVESKVNSKALIEMIDLGEVDANKALKMLKITPKKQFITVSPLDDLKNDEITKKREK